MTKQPTLRDVAAAAGVSLATASLVLNNKGSIPGPTRARILSEIARLKYKSRNIKKRTGSADTIRFLKITRHGHTVNGDHSVFISDYIDGMSSEAVARGYSLEVTSHDNQPSEELLRSLGTAPIKGLVVLGTELLEQDVHAIQSVGLPTVFIDTYHDVVDANFVNMNNEDAVFAVLDRFRSLGFERIGFVASHVATQNFRLRHEAFERNMRRLGFETAPGDVIAIESTLDGAYADATVMLKQGMRPLPCYFCTNDVIAYGFIKALRDFGFRVPQQVSVIGFDNLPLSATMEPAMTTIDVSKRKIGSMAIGVVDSVIRSSEQEPAIKILVGARLIKRASDQPRDLRLTKGSEVEEMNLDFG